MTYRDRRERRAQRLRAWAEKRQQKSAAAFEGARRALDGIEPGQPILVGHHSERHHRAALDRHDRRMAQGFQHQDKARRMASSAAEIERQAEHAIYRDDPDAIERLEERIAVLEAERARVKAVNVAVRRHGLAELLKPGAPFALTEAERVELLKLCALVPYWHVDKKGFPAYHLSNLGGNISRQRARLAELQQRAKVAAALDQERRAEPRETLTGRAFVIDGFTIPEVEVRPELPGELQPARCGSCGTQAGELTIREPWTCPDCLDEGRDV